MRSTIVIGLVGVAGAIALSACGAQISATIAPSTSANPTSSATSAATPTTTTQPTGSPQSTENAAQPAVSANPTNCRSSELKLGFGPGGDHAMQKTFTSLQFTNVGPRTCTLQGFPGVSYVTGDNGQQVGLPADRSGDLAAAVTLRPGASTNAGLVLTNPDPYPADQCKQVTVRGLRVYPPNETAALFLPASGASCSGNIGPLLSVNSVGAPHAS
jgi:Protein of unknown function (DUF4232)